MAEVGHLCNKAYGRIVCPSTRSKLDNPEKVEHTNGRNHY